MTSVNTVLPHDIEERLTTNTLVRGFLELR